MVPIEPSGSLAFRVSSYTPPNRRQFKLTALLEWCQRLKANVSPLRTLFVATIRPRSVQAQLYCRYRLNADLIAQFQWLSSPEPHKSSAPCRSEHDDDDDNDDESAGTRDAVHRALSAAGTLIV